MHIILGEIHAKAPLPLPMPIAIIIKVTARADVEPLVDLVHGYHDFLILGKLANVNCNHVVPVVLVSILLGELWNLPPAFFECVSNLLDRVKWPGESVVAIPPMSGD